MKVIAKFVCNSVEAHTEDQKLLRASAVISGSDENKSFSRWTPSGLLELLISNETKAGNFFTPGEEFFLTFEKQIEVTEPEISKENIEIEEEPIHQFRFLAIIDRIIQKPVFSATTETEALKLFREIHPLATIHNCEQLD